MSDSRRVPRLSRRGALLDGRLSFDTWAGLGRTHGSRWKVSVQADSEKIQSDSSGAVYFLSRETVGKLAL